MKRNQVEGEQAVMAICLSVAVAIFMALLVAMTIASKGVIWLALLPIAAVYIFFTRTSLGEKIIKRLGF